MALYIGVIGLIGFVLVISSNETADVEICLVKVAGKGTSINVAASLGVASHFGRKCGLLNLMGSNRGLQSRPRHARCVGRHVSRKLASVGENSIE